MQSRYPYKLSETNPPPVSWLFDELPDNNVSDDGLSLSSSIAVNEQISEVILTLGNDTILVDAKLMPIIILMHMTAHSAISIRACTLYNQHQLTILWRKLFNLTVLNGLIFDRAYY